MWFLSHPTTSQLLKWPQERLSWMERKVYKIGRQCQILEEKEQSRHWKADMLDIKQKLLPWGICVSHLSSAPNPHGAKPVTFVDSTFVSVTWGVHPTSLETPFSFDFAFPRQLKTRCQSNHTISAELRHCRLEGGKAFACDQCTDQFLPRAQSSGDFPHIFCKWGREMPLPERCQCPRDGMGLCGGGVGAGLSVRAALLGEPAAGCRGCWKESASAALPHLLIRLHWMGLASFKVTVSENICK